MILEGDSLMMGRKGMEEGPKECPTQRMIPLSGGMTYVDSMSSLTLDLSVCVSLTFLSKVDSGLALSYLYSNY